jgi:hypothetical protein
MSPLLVAAAAWLDASLERGRFPVGFEMILERNKSRPALHDGRDGGGGKPMPVAVWYPAAMSGGPRLRLRDYLVASEQALEGLVPTDEGQVVERFIGERSAAVIGMSNGSIATGSCVLAGIFS